MIAEIKGVHEPEAELLTLDEVLEGAEVVRMYLERKRKIQFETHKNDTNRISQEHADRLDRLAQTKAMSEDQVVERALGILFNLAELFDEQAGRQGWSFLSQSSLQLHLFHYLPS